MSQPKEIKQKAITSVIWKFMERICAQVVSLMVTIILARLLQPDDYSVVGIVSVFFTFANVFITGGFNAALIQKKDADEEDYSSVLFLSLGVSLVLYIVLFSCAPYIANLYEKPILVSVIRVMGIVLPVYAVKSVICAYISAYLQFRKFFFATLGGTLASAAIGISMAYAGMGAWALVVQQMTNTIVDTLVLGIVTRMPLTCCISFQKIGSLFSYGWHIFLSSVIGAMYSEINPLFIGLKYTGADLAFYSKGKSFPTLISTVCNSTLSAVLFPVLTRFQDDRTALLRSVRRFIRTGSFIIFPAMMGFMMISENFVLLLLTEKWLPAVQYIRIFCITEMFAPIHCGNCEAIKAMGRSGIYLKMEIIKKTCYFAIIGVAMILTDTPIGLACSMLCCAVVALLVNSMPNIRILGYKVKDQLWDVLPNLLCALVMCLVVDQVHFDGMPVLVEMLLQILTGAVSYILIGVITRNESLIYIWKNVIRRLS